LAVPSTHLLIEVLRRPLETTLAAAVGVQDHLLGALAEHRHRYRQRGLSQIGVQILVDGCGRPQVLIVVARPKFPLVGRDLWLELGVCDCY
jgi:hypothetical protein